MLKTLEITNFQSLEDVRFQLDPNGVNVFVGPTDSGKSAAFRSLILFFENQPLGWDYRSWFNESSGSTTVKVVTDMDDVVVRSKSNTRNVYIVNDEVHTAHPMPPIIKDMFPTNISNFQPQHKPYFLLQDTPGFVGEKFANIVGLHIMDSVTTSAESRVRTLRADKEALKREIQALEHTIETYAGLDEMGTLLEAAEAVKESLAEVMQQIASQTAIMATMQTVVSEIQSQTEIIETLEPLLKETVETLNAATDASDTYWLRQAIRMYTDYDYAIHEETEIINALEPICTEAEQTLAELRTLRVSNQSLDHYIDEWKRRALLIAACNKDIKDYEQEINLAIERIGFCPLCGGVKEKHDEDSDNRGLAHTCE